MQCAVHSGAKPERTTGKARAGDVVIATGTRRAESTGTAGVRRRRCLQLPSPSGEIYEPVEEQTDNY